MMKTITRRDYAGMFGPTTGDRVRLGDTSLIVEVEKRLHALRRRIEIRRWQIIPRWHGTILNAIGYRIA